MLLFVNNLKKIVETFFYSFTNFATLFHTFRNTFLILSPKSLARRKLHEMVKSFGLQIK